MALQYSTTLRNNQVDQIESTIGSAPKLRILTGSPPANCASAQTGTLLVEITLPTDWLAPASGGTVSKNGTWSATASASGTAGYFRIVDASGTTCHMQGTVGTSGADMTIDNTSINSGQTVTVTSFSITAGNA
jgi:hypothetical protein